MSSESHLVPPREGSAGVPAPAVGRPDDAFYAGTVLIAAGAVLDVDRLPEFGASRLLTEWGMDPYLFVGTVWVAGLYVLGVWTLRSRGDHWPMGRSVAFLVGGVGGVRRHAADRKSTRL